jgi:hypothetical protein
MQKRLAQAKNTEKFRTKGEVAPKIVQIHPVLFPKAKPG